MISLHSYLVYTYEQQIFIDEIQVYSQRHIQLSSTRALSGGLTRIIQSLYYSLASRCINAWMHSLKKSVKPEVVNRYDLWVLRHKIGGAKVFVNNVQWSDQMM